MGSIGPYLVDILPGSMMEFPERIVERRPGATGTNGPEIERGSFDVPLSIYYTEATCADGLAAKVLRYGYKQLKGEDVTVTDEDGSSYPNVTVVDVVIETPQPNAVIVNPQTAGDLWTVRAKWLLQLPYTAAPTAAGTG